MSIFSKEPILDVIEHNFELNEMAWRYYRENFNTQSVLFVQPGQEVVFVKEGKIFDILGPGRHVLTTENIPLISKILNLPFGKKESFQCYIYFINKERPVTTKWGTPSPINIIDPRTGRYIKMGARGSMGIKISHSGKFLAKMIGQFSNFYEDDIGEFLFNKTIEYIQTNIAQALQLKKIPFTEIDSYKLDISKTITNHLETDALFEEYGMQLEHFSIMSINVSPDDLKMLQEEENKFIRIKREADAEAEAHRIRGYAEADVMRNKGVYYDKERTYDVLEKAASNEATLGGMMSAGMGLGMGVGVGAGFGASMNNLTNQTLNQTTNSVEFIKCPKCNANNNLNAKFCNECGTSLEIKKIACPKCNALQNEEAKFCSECGHQLIVQKIKCNNCGSEILENMKFCNECGSKVGGSNE